jgi:hypothetical protein
MGVWDAYGDVFHEGGVDAVAEVAGDGAERKERPVRRASEDGVEDVGVGVARKRHCE